MLYDVHMSNTNPVWVSGTRFNLELAEGNTVATHVVVKDTFTVIGFGTLRRAIAWAVANTDDEGYWTEIFAWDGAGGFEYEGVANELAETLA